MTRGTPPAFAGVLLRILPLGDRRAEVEADLLELFALRARRRGERYARRRYYHDVLSLWRRAGMPTDRSSAPVLSRVEGLGKAGVFREIGQDLTYAVRLLRRSPGVVTVTVLGLGLAIGVSTAVFSLLNALAFRPTGIVDPASTVRILRKYQNGMGTSWSYAEYVRLRDGAKSTRVEASLRDTTSFSTTAVSQDGDTVNLSFVSGGYLAILNSRVTLGRILAPSDDVVGAPPVVVVSHGMWTHKLGADPSIIGRPIWLNGAAFTVVGVSQLGFTGTTDTPPAVWAPIAAYHVALGGPFFARTTSTPVHLVGRIAAGASRSQAAMELSAVAVAIGAVREDLEGEPLTGVHFMTAAGRINRSETAVIALVVAIVTTVIGLVLLLACVNVANLLLAGAIAREREIGVRLALGASRGRIVRQLMTESLSLGVVGGVTGLLFTVWLVPILARAARVPVSMDFTPDIRVYLFLAVVSVLAGLGAGLAPARHAMRDNFASPLKGSGGPIGASARSARLRSALVGVQAAASVVLLVLAALLARGMVRATHVDVGFDAGRLLTTSPAFGRGTYDAAGAKAYWDLALDRVRALPGVQSASLAESPPFGGINRVMIFRRAGGRYTIYHNDTRADYFATLGLRAVRGRTYTPDEVADRAPVAVISETLARDFFAGEDPVGQSLDRIVERSGATVIGVVSDAITARLRELRSPTIYRPMNETLGATMVIRSSGAAEALIPSVRSALHPIDPRVRLRITPVSDGLQEQLAEPRTLASLAGALAGLALALAVVGLYGVTAFVAGQRSQEIGVRVALGATGRDIMRLLLGDSLRPVMFGLFGGVFVALLGGRVFAGTLYGVGSADPVAFGAAVLVLLTAAVAAVIVPTRRAAAVDPATVLRQL
jgi:predicted permease